MSWLSLIEWISENDMTDEQKKRNPNYKTIGGFLHTKSYKDAWAACPKKVVAQIKKLKNFDAKKFEEITGLKA